MEKYTVLVWFPGISSSLLVSMLSGSQESIAQQQLLRAPAPRSIAKEEHANTQDGEEGVEMQQMGA